MPTRTAGGRQQVPRGTGLFAHSELNPEQLGASDDAIRGWFGGAPLGSDVGKVPVVVGAAALGGA
jgi:hypothetical protein